MKKILAEPIEESVTEEPHVSAFGYELIREIVIRDILGEDSYHILYWAGKQLARKFPLSSVGEVVTFFQSAGWGRLVIEKETKDEMELTLTGEMINRRLDLYSNSYFQLEAGFLAEQCAIQKKFNCEAIADFKKRSNKALFTVKWDTKDPLY